MTRKTQTIANVNRKQGRAMSKTLGPIKGERPTDAEINEPCNLRKTSK